AHAADRASLIITFDNGLADLRFGQLPARCAALYEQFQLGLLIEFLHCTGRMRGVVPHPMLISVRVKDDWPLTESLFQAISIKFCLLLADSRVALRFLCFNKGERFSIAAPEHVIHEPFVRFVGHPSNGKLAVLDFIESPTGF